jgi:excisionase family DNA binding protein
MTMIDKRPARVPARRLASIADAADYAACSGKTIRRRIADGTIPGYRFGKRSLRVDLADIDGALSPIPTAAIGHGRRGR